MSPIWLTKLQNNEIVLIDGATGTELQRRGVPMDEIAWSGAAVLSHPEIVRQTHEDYIRAGAEVIIANTFGATRQMLEPAGYGDQVESVNHRAVKLAIQARENSAEHPVAVAGSISAMPPGFDREGYDSPDKELACYREAAGILADAGADLIALEMMEDTNHAPLAVTAALETGLPVWLGISCKRRKTDDRLVGFGYENVGLEEVFDKLLPMKPAIVNMMHTEVHAVAEAIALLRDCWDGPMGAYPESGYFTRPNWNFVDIIDPKDLVDHAKQWVAAGVRLLGGCCGTGPEHIAALKEATPEFMKIAKPSES